MIKYFIQMSSHTFKKMILIFTCMQLFSIAYQINKFLSETFPYTDITTGTEKILA